MMSAGVYAIVQGLGNRMGVRRALYFQVVEDAGGLPQAVERHQRHDRHPDEKQQVRRARRRGLPSAR
jgi:hypothetical protein